MSRRTITDADVAAIAKAVALGMLNDDGPCMRLPVTGSCDVGGFIYFVRCRAPGSPVKIGHAKDVARRVSNLQMGCPFPLELAACYWVADPQEEESRLHERFGAASVRGEWFLSTPELIALITGVSQRQAEATARLLA